METEKVESPQYAGLLKRLLAGLIDGVLVSAVTLVFRVLFLLSIFFIYVLVSSAGSPTGQIERSWLIIGIILTTPMLLLIRVLVSWFYFAVMESSSTQATLGKLALNIKVADIRGQRISFARATGRHFAKILSYATLCVGFIMIAFTPRKQGLHDIIAETLVVCNHY